MKRKSATVLPFPTRPNRSVPIRDEGAVVIVLPVIRIERDPDSVDMLTGRVRRADRALSARIRNAKRLMTQRLKDELNL